ncbi:recombination regulator RecX [Cytobacillus sp. FJAT-54145]|uniref:Regulatory protein RecX n=1 Tax=Cytobacillus spartinae TaxID=3299023 RepID=A0ABW6K8Q4_9BACI
MPVITKIAVQKNNLDRYSIFVDYGKGEEYAFSVDEDVLIKFNLKKGMELDDFSLTEINFQDDIRKAYNLGIHYLSRKMRTETEVRDYLKTKEVDEPIIQEVIHKLYEYQFLNDPEFAGAYVRTQMNTSEKGTDLIKRELREKGVSSTTIENALMEYTLTKQLENAKQLCDKYIQKYKKDSERILKQKLEQLLLRKGHPHQVISLALEEVAFEKEEDEEMAALRHQAEKAHRKFSNFTGFEYNQKMKQTLYRKGFSIDMIERYLNEREDY